ncbi:competence/damage-inducible protein A [Erysipelothrix rhusiopathiae]|uniref:competence/damage-inducible protein A n=1 Tax=unclassified Erysipelothrix TaxID=2624170 RepID=UPI001377E1DC|nr:competence/damage-inducible protein A [Erysipelothrix sp. strain 2 (EsS2-7-Brazil)]MBK2403354.1 competence/damage-inducible protein A [Erysipelothrix sp. strain 2 (EsS2-7-Brazil)]NBA00678.1 competence/damage-inducible protein A [Erysipelothrix rhusiopathiae]
MKAEIICVGTELLLGDVVNTNATYIAQQLASNGIFCYHQSVVGDNPNRLEETFKEALKRSELIIFTGGLGPTYDDLTKEVIAEVLERPLTLHQPSMNKLEAYFKTTGRSMTENNIKQAMIPQGAHVFENLCGTAPGVCIETKNHTVIMLPGPPREMTMMFETSVNDYLSQKTNLVLVSHKLYLFGIGESKVESILKDKMIDYQNPTIAPYVADGSVMLRVTASGKTYQEADALIKPVLEEIKDLFYDFYYSTDIPALESVIVPLLASKNMTVATAESCTGGLISSRITRVSGSSQVFNLGVTTYSNEQKHKILNIPQAYFETVGAVSPEVAAQMATNVRLLAESDLGVGITGIAGPTGGSDEKPVGLVYVAIATAERVSVKRLQLGRNHANERIHIQEMATNHALKLILDEVKNK